jgi:hypothetical protein
MEIKKVIEASLGYGKKYGILLDRKRLLERLISKKIYKTEEVDKVISKEKINLGIYSKKKKIIYEEKMELARNLASKLSKFRTILFMGVSGSVASEYPKNNDDIDIFIICKNNSLWVTRAGVMVYVWITGIPHRRRGENEKKNEFCFNLWIDENELEMPKAKQDLKNAMDAVLVKTLINRGKAQERFMAANRWIGDYLAQSYAKYNKKKKIKNKKSGNLLLKIINILFYWGQYGYMKKRITNEVVDINKAFFHPNSQI